MYPVTASCRFAQSISSISMSTIGEAGGVSVSWPSCIVLRRFVIRHRLSRAAHKSLIGNNVLGIQLIGFKVLLKMGYRHRVRPILNYKSGTQGSCTSYISRTGSFDWGLIGTSHFSMIDESNTKNFTSNSWNLSSRRCDFGLGTSVTWFRDLVKLVTNFRHLCWFLFWSLESLTTFFVCVWTMFTIACWACDVFGLKVHRFQLEVARAIMSRTGWLDVLTANAVRCIPKSGQVINSPAGVCSMFIRRFRICSTEKRIGTLPLSRMSMHVVIQPLCARSLRKWITNLSLTVDCSPLAKANLLEQGCLENQMWSRFGCCWQACTRRSMAKRDPMALVQPGSRIIISWMRTKIYIWFVFWLFWFAKLHVTTGVHVTVFLLTASSHARTEP